MRLNNNYIHKRLDDSWYFLSASGVNDFAIKNKTGCLIVEKLLSAETPAQAKSNLLGDIPIRFHDAGSQDFERIFNLLNNKYGVFADNAATVAPAADAGNTVARELSQKMAAVLRVTKCHIELTDYCNFGCRMCYLNPLMGRKQPRALTTEEFGEIVRLLEKDGLIYLMLTGGEPLLNPQITDILSSLQDKNFFISINTNGSVLNAGILSALKKIRLRSIAVSIYGFSENTYKVVTGRPAYARVIENVKAYQSAGLPLLLKYILQKENVSQAKAFKNYCEKNKINHIISNGTFMPDVGGNTQQSHALEHKELEPLYRENILKLPNIKIGTGCKPARTRLAIDAYGNVFPCEFIRLNLGNILTGDADKIIGPGNTRLRVVNQATKPDSAACANCTMKAFCSAQACPAPGYLTCGKIGGKCESACNHAKLLQLLDKEIGNAHK